MNLTELIFCVRLSGADKLTEKDVVAEEQKRVLLKISGETLSGKGQFGISRQPLEFMIREIQAAREEFELNLA